MTFQGYDYNNKGEVSVLVNNQVVDTLPTSYASQNAKTFVSFTLDISNYIVSSGSNTITFRQNQYSSGVQNVKVTGPNGVLLSDISYHSIWIGGTSSVSYKFSTSSTTSTTTTKSFPTGTSWNSRVACTPIKVKISDITARATGSTSYANSMFSPGITVPSYAPAGSVAKRWLTSGPTPSGWVSPGPPCSIRNSKGQVVGVFVEIDGVKRAKVVDEDYHSTYDPINGGRSMPNGKIWPDSTFNIYDPTVSSGSCSSPTDSNCYARIHLEIDSNWKAAGYCGSGTACDNAALASKTSSYSTLIDVQGFIFWDPGHELDQWHSFSGWELHPLTAWRVH
ncbi:MAG: hypothetical protein M1503_05185 [Thaumarchaeota archaeon]|nr:hypothetical protein [Nitrososphaerota archaeon]MCL5317644.1 hypothetical protein [Nitrososphaerota archaeon]